MTVTRFWLPVPGVRLVYRSVGFPMPELDHAARAELVVSSWPWERTDVHPCQGVEPATDRHPSKPWWTCKRLAVWLHDGPSTHGYYCGDHLPAAPSGGPIGLCRMCGGPLDPAASNTHPTCAPDDGDVTEAEALVTLLAAFPDCEELTP